MVLYYSMDCLFCIMWQKSGTIQNRIGNWSIEGESIYDWGGTFDNAVFLEEKPMILSYEKNSKSLIFGQNGKGNGVNRIYY